MPRISENVINEIRAQADIVDIIKEYIPLTPKGKNYFGVCPFHQDHSPSMSVSKEKQMFKCFSCGAAGNVFKFVSDYENISFIEAVAKVASKVGIPLTITGDYKPKEKFQKEYDVMNLATLFFQNNLNTSLGTKAKDYLSKRGLNEEMVKVFDIGLALDKNTLYQFLNKKKIAPEDMVSLGLVNQSGLTYHDVFVNRIIFPIHDASGHVVGFTGRVYDGDYTPKYLNSKETSIFRKGNILFNYHRARDAIRTQKKVIMVEGNMDAIRMYVSGLQNTIALMGTSLTTEQVVLLQKLRVPVLLMFDNDEAGKTATMKNGQILIDAGITVEVVRLHGAKDPDEYILSNGIQAMKDNIEHPLSYLEFKYNALKENKNLEDTEELSLYVKGVLASLEHADEITIDITLNKLVQEFHLSYDILKSQLDTKKVEPVKQVPVKEKRVTKKSKYDLCAELILYYMMNDLKYVKMYQTKLGYFKSSVYRGIANEIIYYVEKNKTIELADFLSYAETSPLKEDIYRILESIKTPEIVETSMEDYIFNIKECTWEEEIKKLKVEMKQTSDIHEKENLAKKIVDFNKKIQEMLEERSVM
ncbi:TPA: DNA primase [Candidatus Ventrenecus stercoripullorum]|nr:DNA primase [Candidatus Ventrenecus stercoripullorum]